MQNIKRVLREFPELWALRQDWISPPEIKICRAPAIGFLMQPIYPSDGMKKVTPYVVMPCWQRMEPLAESYCGKPLIEDETRAQDLQRQLRIHLGMLGDKISYVFLHEERLDGRDRIIIVKPPTGDKNFRGYLNRLRKTA